MKKKRLCWECRKVFYGFGLCEECKERIKNRKKPKLHAGMTDAEWDERLQRDAFFLSELAGLGHLIAFITAIVGLILFLAI